MFPDSVRTVPDVVQKSARDAGDALEGEGFLVRLEQDRAAAGEELDIGRCPNARVIRSEPAGGEKVVKATTVTIFVGRCG